MSEPFVGQLLLVPYNFPPKGWAFCQGQLMAISQNTALFSLLGTYYGGNGTSNFALPNLQGSVPIAAGRAATGTTYNLGQTGGEQTVSLNLLQIPSHNHVHEASTAIASSSSPTSATFAAGGGRGHQTPYYVGAPAAAAQTALSPTAVTSTGQNQPHSNLMPFLTLNWIIALQGVFPPRP